MKPPHSSSVSEPIVSEPDAPLGRIPEAVLQDAWARRLYSPADLNTTTGQPVVVLDPGTQNRGSGPDFSNASLRIGAPPNELVWAGDVEIHRTSDEWNAHSHGEDPAYNRVVLHVILSPDHATGTLTRADGSSLPEMALLPHLDRTLRALAHDFYVRGEPTPPYCERRWHEVPLDRRLAWVRALGRERLAERAARLGRAFGRSPDLDRLLIGGLFRALGYAYNADTMERLASRLPLTTLRQLDDPEDVQAALIGLAGLTDDRLFGGDQAERFHRLRKAHDLPAPLDPAAWRHGGRPANAPRRRLRQAAAMLSQSGSQSGLLRRDALESLRQALGTPEPLRALRSLLRGSVVEGVRGLGKARADVALINAVLPVLLLDAEMREDHAMEAQVMAVLEALPPESDRITQQFEQAGLAAQDALESQGVHQLAGAYCQEGRCARCAIGQALYPAFART